MRQPGTVNDMIMKAKKRKPKEEDLSQYDDRRFWTKDKKKKK